MAKHKGSKGKQGPPRRVDMRLGPREQGLRAFQGGHFDLAVAIWTPLAPHDPPVAAALPEAHFRRALTRPVPGDQLGDLRRAVALAPREPRYQYHLARALHRAGDLPAAVGQYRAVLAQWPAWPGAAAGLALATLAQNPRADLAALPGSQPVLRATFAPVQALLRGEPPPPGDTALAQLWTGLGQVAAGDPAAQTTCDESRSLPTSAAVAVRRYYKGVAAAQVGDLEGAVRHWQRVAEEGGVAPPWALANLAAVLYGRLLAQREAGDLDAAVATAQSAHPLAGSSPALGEALVLTLDQGARAAAVAGDWARAVALWEGARQVVAAAGGLGSPRPLLHNLALAYEALESWIEAADAWRGMLRTRPRAGARAGEGETDDAQWAWVRKRVIACYKKAGAPGEAVAVFRQAIKADPDDPELRLELAEALLANEQDQAAANELHRVLEINPQHVEALLQLAHLQLERREVYLVSGTLSRLQALPSLTEDVQRRIGALFLEVGQQTLSWGGLDGAATAFEAGQKLAPADYHFPLNLARIAVSRKDLNRARSLLERALELGADDPDAYLLVIDCWAVAGNMEEVQAVLSRAEAALPGAPDFYVGVAVNLLRFAAPRPQFDLFSPRPVPATPVDSPWTKLATDLLQRGAALRPTDGRLRMVIASDLLEVRPDLALPFAEEGVRMLPEDAPALLMLGLLQALNDRKREAKETLRRAARFARQQGDMELVGRIEELRRLVDNPMLPLVLKMGPMFGGLNDEDFF